MNVKIFLVATILVFIGCKNISNTEDSNTILTKDAVDQTFETKKESEKSRFVPDIKINDLELANPNSILKSVGDLKPHLVDNGSSFVEFTDYEGKTKLTLTTFPGSSYNDIYQIKVEQLVNHCDLQALTYKNFITESNITLGISKNELINIKGNNYLTDKNVIKYFLSPDENRAFLEQYNLPFYYANYTFENDRLIIIDFGFLYP